MSLKCVCVYNILLSGKTTDMQLLIHIINLINQYYRKIAKHTAEEIIQSINKEQLVEIELLDYDRASNLKILWMSLQRRIDQVKIYMAS